MESAEVLMSWASRGLRAATKSHLPIAVLADPEDAPVQPIADKLADLLKNEGFTIVPKKEGAFFVIVSNAAIRDINYYDSRWHGFVYFILGGAWAGTTNFVFWERFSDVSDTVNKDDAQSRALDVSVAEANQFILKFVSGK
jgi:hypothetical protein